MAAEPTGAPSVEPIVGVSSKLMVRTSATLGVELMFPTGGVPLSVQTTTGYAWKVSPKLSLFVGVAMATARSASRCRCRPAGWTSPGPRR